MKKLAIIIFVFACAHPAGAQEIQKLKIGQLMKMIDTASTPLVVNFFATWCGPCIREIPWFEKNIKISDKKVKLLLVSIDFADDYPKTVSAFVKKQGYSSQVVWLNETNADVFCPPVDKTWDGAIPVTLMVNNKKKYRQFYGQQLPEEKFKLELQKLLQ
ncbi:MAG: TlpA family protein disulfide reductase [Chitinophagaceae bacterium]|nr:TlpA family protein disulfide reductase [Chitinophagaceae bacterium]